jgi:hypothetical protein
MNLRARAGLTLLQLSAAPGQSRSEPSTVLRYAIAVLSVAVALIAAPGGYVPADRAVRIVVSLRDYVRCMVWRYWPRVVRDWDFHCCFLLLFSSSNKFIYRKV